MDICINSVATYSHIFGDKMTKHIELIMMKFASIVETNADEDLLEKANDELLELKKYVNPKRAGLR